MLVPKKAKRKTKKPKWVKLTPKRLSRMMGDNETSAHIHYSQQATQNLLGYQFNKHIEAVEEKLREKLNWNSLGANQYAALVSHIYVPVFLREHFNMALDTKRISKILMELGIDNFTVLKAIRMLTDVDIVAAVKKIRPKHKHELEPSKKKSRS